MYLNILLLELAGKLGRCIVQSTFSTDFILFFFLQETYFTEFAQFSESDAETSLTVHVNMLHMCSICNK